ncbi:hypothetical protein GE061_006798 [Apolygus lucorum]|uniref:Uncharacterized protein n=1 Tax=Apolygus lucorum TaxID=248454 RepID=A0A8S9WSH4_APOLU|nr:hypothetical protein GE061_006798 [Apolygus lucorum]
MFARKACSCSRLIHPMSVFRRIIKEMLVRRPLSVKAPFALLEHLPRAFVRGSGSEPEQSLRAEQCSPGRLARARG